MIISGYVKPKKGNVSFDTDTLEHADLLLKDVLALHPFLDASALLQLRAD